MRAIIFGRFECRGGSSFRNICRCRFYLGRRREKGEDARSPQQFRQVETAYTADPDRGPTS